VANLESGHRPLGGVERSVDHGPCRRQRLTCVQVSSHRVDIAVGKLDTELVERRTVWLPMAEFAEEANSLDALGTPRRGDWPNCRSGSTRAVLAWPLGILVPSSVLELAHGHSIAVHRRHGW